MVKKRVSKQFAVPPYRLVGSLLVLSAVSLALLAYRVLDSESMRYLFLATNLFLAAVPLFLAWWLVERVRHFGWLKWQQIALTLLWIVFLPNSFYIVTDLIHLRSNFEADPLFDIALLMSFIVTGFIFGAFSVYMVHRELVKRLPESRAYGLIGLLFLAASFAITLGRYTRWNSWDIILAPAGLLFDVSDRLINPGLHAQTYQTTLTMFVLTFGTYVVIWEASRLLRPE